MAHELICSLFFLKLLNDDKINDNDDPNNSKTSHVTATLNKELKCLAQDVVNHLRAYGGDTHLIVFLTGSFGAGKSTVVKAVCQFFYTFL